MNPKEFSWTEDQRVTVINPTSETYKFKVHNKDYELGPQKSAEMPGWMAWVYVYGLSTQLAQQDGVFNRWNEEGFRQEYYERLVKRTDQVVQAIKEEPVSDFEELDNEADGETEDSTENTLAGHGETYTPELTTAQDDDDGKSNPEPEIERSGPKTPDRQTSQKIKPVRDRAKAKVLRK